MKRLILLMILPFLLTGFPSCQMFNTQPQAVTTTTNNGVTSTTSIPVLAPKDVAHQANCQAVLDSKFE